MSAVALNNASHAHGGSTLEKSPGDDGISSRDGVASTGDGQDTIVNALYNLADTGLDTSLVSEISDILATFANNDTGFLGRDNGAKGELGLSVLLVRLRGGFTVGAEALVDSKLIHLVDDIAAVVGGEGILRGRHFGGGSESGRRRWVSKFRMSRGADKLEKCPKESVQYVRGFLVQRQLEEKTRAPTRKPACRTVDPRRTTQLES